MKGKYSYFIWAAVFGIIALALTILFRGHTSSTHTLISYILELIVALFAFFSGRSSKKQGRKPLWNGALVGAIFGFIGTLGTFFVKMNASAFKNTNLTSTQISTTLHYVNSPAAHVVSVIVATCLYGVIGLIIGIIGGATTKKS